MTHYERCLQAARAHYEGLLRSKTNRWAIEGIVKSYLEQPAYDGYRAEIMRELFPSPSGGEAVSGYPFLRSDD